jgi:pilus assembly protein CpaB
MNRRDRTLIVLLVAVALASAATFFVYRAITRIPVRQVEVASLYVAVAAENLPMGTRLKKEQIKLAGWPASSPVQGSFATADSLVGRGLIQSVHANEPLTENKLAPVEAGAGLPPSIPQGMRALSVRVNDVIGVAGFTTPGTRVDVLVVLNRGEISMSRAVVSNVQVLTAGTLYDQEQSKDGKAIPSTVVTLMVTPEDAERIALAQSSGAITLVLRNPLDTEPTNTRGVRLPSLMGAPDAPAEVAVDPGEPRVRVRKAPVPAAAPAPSKFYSIEAIRGAKRTDEVVKQEEGGKAEGEAKQEPAAKPATAATPGKVIKHGEVDKR